MSISNSTIPTAPAEPVTALQTSDGPFVATLRKSFESPYVQARIREVAARNIDQNKVIAVLIAVVAGKPELRRCTTDSIIRCAMLASKLGLEPDGRLAHLIAYGEVCTLAVDWKGYVTLCRRNGVTRMRTALVYQEDVFQIWDNETGIHHEHRPMLSGERGGIRGAYSACEVEGASDIEYIPVAEIDAIRARAPSKNSDAWRFSYGEMARKVAFRRHTKRLPIDPTVAKAIEEVEDGQEEEPVKIDTGAPASLPKRGLFTGTAPQKSPVQPATNPVPRKTDLFAEGGLSAASAAGHPPASQPSQVRQEAGNPPPAAVQQPSAAPQPAVKSYPLPAQATALPQTPAVSSSAVESPRPSAPVETRRGAGPAPAKPKAAKPEPPPAAATKAPAPAPPPAAPSPEPSASAASSFDASSAPPAAATIAGRGQVPARDSLTEAQRGLWNRLHEAKIPVGYFLQFYEDNDWQDPKRKVQDFSEVEDDFAAAMTIDPNFQILVDRYLADGGSEVPN